MVYSSESGVSAPGRPMQRAHSAIEIPNTVCKSDPEQWSPNKINEKRRR
jgi:hypothetical protein